jgi:hypothetical protein
MFQMKVLEEIKTRILCSVTFCFEGRTLNEITWKNNVERCRPQMAIWRMRIACWVPKATDTHSEYVTRIALPLQQWLRERASMFVIRTSTVLLLTLLAFFSQLLKARRGYCFLFLP